MGQLVREFSGDLNTFTQDPAYKTLVSPKAPSLQSYPSEFDLSMDHNLLPRPAMTPTLYFHAQGHDHQENDESMSHDTLVAKAVHIENKQARLVEIKTGSDRTVNQGTRAEANQNQVQQEVGQSGNEPVDRDTTNGKLTQVFFSYKLTTPRCAPTADLAARRRAYRGRDC
jgi:hypothetical protein